jgi:bifunctional DNA-binding transcriptional regulator/antitoxin component of YhaV-PrlF toxin-antitoxin module
MTKYVTKVFAEDDDYILEFPDKLLEELGWEIGNTLAMEIKDDAIVVRKVEDK